MLILKKLFPLLLLIVLSNPLFAQTQSVETSAEKNTLMRDEGIRFSCMPDQLDNIASNMATYLIDLGISPSAVVKKLDKMHGVLVYTLNTSESDTNTLDFITRSDFQIHDEKVHLPGKNGRARTVQTVSKKEIVLALLQHGRLTEFKNGACDLQALIEHVAVRQNIVAWAENLNWDWTDGGYAKWNARFWRRGTPISGVSLHQALSDVFLNQSKYSFGCYAATKLVLMQGVLDYYRRIKHAPSQLRQVENRLTSDGEPLVNIEPGKMWSFEKDFDPDKLNRPGKIAKIDYGIAPKNFVPGDWIYILNTDPRSYQKTGYEGSNAIYLGRNKFDDYYNDHYHAYTYQQKVNEVFQWRYGVFNRIRDAAKAKPLNAQDMERLGKSPDDGGIVTDIRVSPYYFGFEQLPD